MKEIIIITGLIACAGIALAEDKPQPATTPQQMIKVQVQVSTPKDVSVTAVGFSVGKTSAGSLGSTTTKNGPSGATYSFGVRSGGQDINCGTAKLTENSIVKLTYDGEKCKLDKVVKIKE